MPQILAAMLTCAVLEVAHHLPPDPDVRVAGQRDADRERRRAHPARRRDAAGDPWSTNAWWLFATVAGLSLLSKYVIRYHGSHVFNPSNIGLVVAFIVLGSSVVEPLDFWWAPLNVWMIAAYAVIITGGLLITRRLKLLGLAATFWVTLGGRASASWPPRGTA